MAKDYEYLEDYFVGETMVSPGRTLTEADIVNFAGFTGDWHPLHTDVTYASQTPFGERIAHGMLTLSLGMALPLRLGYLPRSFIAFYGMDSVRFTAPARIGDTLHCVVDVIELVDKDDHRGVLVMRQAVKNQKGELLVTLVSKVLCGKRPK
jgi:acyl dehydratase